MSRRLAVLAALSLLAACSFRDEEPVPWAEAPARCEGWLCAVSGTVVASQDTGAVVELYFDSQRRDAYVTLVKGWTVDWPSYVGHPIVATGRVRQYKGAIEIMVKDPSAIIMLDALTPAPAMATESPAPTGTPVPDATSTPPPAPPSASPAPGEVDQLKKKVEDLEQRLRELEER
ncbi:MAG: hypothetical protein ACRERC_27120 [Candidatus Binatia bacterium]